ncbi:hypothetical protein SS50377_25718 [Spironucleus salmonicida]|uniref:Uncharacterized protein n=1 Tax=Spironucleus salmonicida TaxID=348837 RepID=A0A9P8LNW3_9EUKA|nr:hypothetical protein SS50377_25718 [Spironucleus salmonicida]
MDQFLAITKTENPQKQFLNIDFVFRNSITNLILAKNYEEVIKLLLKYPKVLIHDNTQLAFKVLELIRTKKNEQLIQIAKYVAENAEYNNILIDSIQFIQSKDNEENLIIQCITLIQKELLRGKMPDNELQVLQ